ncbi:unnamed protein product, partial [marine sediment metagenome]
TPQHVKAGRILVKAGYMVEAGTIVSFVKTTTKGGVSCQSYL